MIKDFTDLFVWQKAHELVVKVYVVIKGFPKYEQHGLSDQMRRSSVSITSNIAEGFSRQGLKEKIQFYFMAAGSLTELRNQILIARDVGYLSSSDDLEWISSRIVEVEKMLSGLIKSSKARI